MMFFKWFVMIIDSINILIHNYLSFILDRFVYYNIIANDI